MTVNNPTLAQKMGVEPSVSQLLQKAKGLGLHSPELLESLAVARGCWHYRNSGVVPAPAISESDFSNEELAVALLSPSWPYSPHTIRVGAAMVGAVDNDVATLVDLAVAEGNIAPVRYIASAGLRFEPDNLFWPQLLERLPESAPMDDGVMPHPTRFVSMTGITRGKVGLVTVWIRPRADLSMAHG